MRLKTLTICNFGIYGGEYHFELEPQVGTIILFGGKNGAGKTTLLESIRLCLYGPRTLGDRVSQREYEEYLISRIHHHDDKQLLQQKTFINLAFEYTHDGKRHDYFVSRQWQIEEGNLKEKFEVYEDNEELSDLTVERWQNFILDLVPPAISELFFFDGEKIQSLAQDDTSNAILAKSIKGLLGLDLIERLKSDLEIYHKRELKKAALQEIKATLEQRESERDKLQNEYLALRQEFAHTEMLIQHLEGKIDDKELEIATESRGHAQHRQHLKEQSVRLEERIAQVEKSIHELSAGLLPFALLPELGEKLLKSLQEEANYQQWLSTIEWIKPRIQELESKFSSVDFWQSVNGQVAKKEQQLIIQILFNELDELIKPPKSIENVALLYNLSQPDYLKLKSWISEATTNVPGTLQTLTQNLENATRQRQETQQFLQAIPDEDILRPIYEELNKLNLELGSLQEQAKQQETKLSSLASQRDEAQRALERAYGDLRSVEKVDRRINLTQRTQAALNEFLQLLTQKKVHSLAQIATDRFNQLNRKTEFVAGIKIDPQDFSISLQDAKGNVIPKSALSAGEKQIYAVAMLWALRQLSGRPLPVIIDTPLGRLDSEHRQNLINYYFPYTSHQVIILSTDTEIDQDYFEALSDHISHAYHLEYDPKTGAALVNQGYFWKEQVNAT